jgi:lipopolysaccharide transport system permease protein
MGGQPFAHPWAFTLYLCAGLLPWNAFTEMLTRAVNTFHEHATLVKKVNFPKEILLTIAVGSASVPLFLSLGLLLAVLLISGYGISFWILTLPLVFFLQALFAYGLGLMLSVLNVFFRDIQQIVPIVLQLWFWATPLVYTVEKVPEAYRWILYCNPYFYFAFLYQQALFFKEAPSLFTLAMAGICASISFGLGSMVYQHFSKHLADEL